MIKKIYNTVALFSALLAAGCGESLEETYDEFSGDGMIRYVGKCAEVSVNPGWERLQVVWKHNIDAGIKKVKITWQSEQGGGEKFVEPYQPESGKLMDTFYIENLSDAMYTVRVSNVAADDRESLVEEKYGRPYSLAHEDLYSFSRGITAFSRMGDKLAVMLEADNENVKEMLLCFKDKAGKEHIWDMKAHANDSLSYELYGMDMKLGRDYLFLLPDEEGVEMDFDQPITVRRKGMLEGCVDEIHFEDVKLDLNERLWTAPFAQTMLAAYGPKWEEKVESLETLELDYDLSSFQNLMYFPKLKKVVLGKNRYMPAASAKKFYSTTDEYMGLVMLQFLKSTREDFSVERYNNHYFNGKDDFMNTFVQAYKLAGKLTDLKLVEKKSANLDAKPAYTLMDTTGWTVTCSDTMSNGYKDNGAAMLLFDTPRRILVDYGWTEMEEEVEVYFQPAPTLGSAVVTVTYDMKEPKAIQGFKVGQYSRNDKGDTDYLLSNIKIELSVDGYAWTNATYTDGSAVIGNSPGEETYIPIPEDLQVKDGVRYVRLTMANRNVGTISGMATYSLRLGKFIPCTVEQ